MTSRVVVIERNPSGPRLYLLSQRVHHGAVASILIPLTLRHRRLRTAALIVMAHDAHDARIWYRRETPPPVKNNKP